MSLDDLWAAVKKLKYPIKDAKQLEKFLGKLKLKFDGEELDARDIAMEITQYPIKSAADLIRDFLKDEEEYSTEEAVEVSEILEKEL